MSELSDSLGDWQQHTFQRLQAARAAGEPITVWVNPDAPEESVIDRAVRVEVIASLLFAVLLFGGLGFVLLLSPWITALNRPEVSTVDELLQSEADWRKNRILPSGRGGMWLLKWVAMLLLFISAILLFRYKEFINDGLSPKLLVFLFPPVTAWLIFRAIAHALREHRFGAAVLRLSPYPGAAGGAVAGRVDLPLSTAGQTVTVRLSCIHLFPSRPSGKGKLHEKILWQEERQLPLQQGPHGGRIEFAFAPPAGLPASSAGREHHKWEVALEAELEGPDLALKFAVPVTADKFATEEWEDDPAPPPMPAGNTPAPLPAWFMLTQRMGAMEYTLPLLRNMTADLPLMLIGGAIGAFGLFLWTGMGATRIFSLIFILIGAVMFFRTLYRLGNTLQVRISPVGVTVSWRILGIPFKQRIAAAELAGIHKCIISGGGGKGLYAVVLTTKRGRSVRVADSLPSAGAAVTLIGEIRRYLKLALRADTGAAGRGG